MMICLNLVKALQLYHNSRSKGANMILKVRRKARKWYTMRLFTMKRK